MTLISIDELKPLPPPPKFALFALGFRPFFLGAGIFAVLLIALWLALYRGSLPLALFIPMEQWHAHEMIFGFTSAVIAGFLLTAVQNWTGMKTPSGKPLAVLFFLWLAGRLLPFVPGLPSGLYALVDAALFPAVMVAIARPILRAKQLRNVAFPVMLGMLTLSNLLVHAEWLGYAQSAHTGFLLAIYMIVLMMVVMGGRVIPSFTDNKLRTKAKRWKALEWLAPATTLATLSAVLVQPVSPITALIAAIAAAIHSARLAGWYTGKYWSVPLLWVLHLGYGWIVMGFVLTALSALEMVAPSLALHAFTAGAMGTLTLGMMARVALGHTGRMLEPAKIINMAFGLITLAAAIRVCWPIVMPGTYATAILISGLFWIMAFAIFVLVYAPILIQSRVDGKPG
jgi:uncharacterized protein involved in response to NO